MDFEKLLKKFPKLEVVTDEDVIKEALGAKPSFGLNSSLYIGCEIYEILSFKIVKPKINGVIWGATTMLECRTNGNGSTTVTRFIYLSSLIRKLDTHSDYRGIISTHRAFDNHRSFNDNDWISAFKKVCPLKVLSRKEGLMVIHGSNGSSRDVPIFEVELQQC